MIGKTIAHYRVTEMIGKGGMGVVYKARDTHLDRNVAIKVLPAEAVANADRKRRFVQEAKAASALNHSNIITIHDISHSDGVDFIAMEYIEGHTLHQLIGGSGLAIEQALDYAVQITSALAAAHAAGIVHRDLKPSNIMVTEKGVVKVLDFGLAKLTESVKGSESSITETMTPKTEQGAIVGTAAYVSPEQAEGKDVDARSDVFSFGAAFYEMLSGRRAFQGESYISTLSAILGKSPTSIRKLRAEIPAALERIVNRCLEKNREARYASGSEVWKDLTALHSQLAARRVGFGQILGRPRIVMPALIVLVALAATIGWFWVRSSRIRWARTVALPEIAHLQYDRRGYAALRLIERAEPYLQGDPEFERLRQNSTLKISIRTDPPGADFSIRDYNDVADNAEWMHLGRTPLESVVIPAGFLAYRIKKPGFDEVEGTASYAASVGPLQIFQRTLNAIGTSPPGMIWVPARPATLLTFIQTVPIRNMGLEGYWLDKYEVTNRQFKEFVDRGGYEKKEYWKNPFVNEDGIVVAWEEAMASFTDSTGRPGPASWEYGTYPQDRADYPVSGVSWYEASAYAEFAGKSLPTMHHWASAAGGIPIFTILQVSNFAGKGPAPVGSYRGLSPFGSYDMAGNVKEWCLNSSGAKRYILGGAWNEPNYMFSAPDLRPPMDRSPANGFRCAKYKNAPPKELTGVVQLILKDRRGDKAVNDTIFQIYKTFHEYDHGDLKPKIEEADSKPLHWRLEKVSYQAAYGNERVAAYLYLPKNATPPYQTVVIFPSSGALSPQTSENLEIPFIIRTGRAMLYPIYKGTYERTIDGANDGFYKHNRVWREIAIDDAKDLGRSLDYLETRPEIDREKLAYCGFSMGACEGPRLIALEPRFKAGVLLFGGAYEREWPAEIDPFNFAPHTRVPILMLNGRYDPFFTLAASQIPLFQMLGTPEKDKKHVVVEGGHAVLNEEIIRETLSWLDRYLGPVHTR